MKAYLSSFEGDEDIGIRPGAFQGRGLDGTPQSGVAEASESPFQS